MKAPLFRIGGEGDIDLESQTMDYLVKVAIVNTSSGQGGEALNKLKGITLPIRLRGDLSSPSYSLDMKALYSFFVKSKIDEKKGEFLQEKLGIEGGEELSTKDVLKQALFKKLSKDKGEDSAASNAEPEVYDPEGTSTAVPDVQADPNAQAVQEEQPEEDTRSSKDKLKDEVKNRLLKGLFN